MINLVLRVLITIAALKVADFLLPDFEMHGDFVHLVGFALAVGLLNWCIKPVLVFFSFPLIILTIGFFYFVINAVIIYSATKIVPGFLTADGFGLLFGSTIVSIVHWFLTFILRVEKHSKDSRN
jgi:putative membrane protein